YVGLKTARAQAQGGIQGIKAPASGGAIEVRSLHVHHADQGLDRARHQWPSRHTSLTSGTRGRLTGQFAHMAMCDNRVTETTREVLPEVPPGLSHRGQVRVRIGQLRLQGIEPLVKASMEVVAQSLPLGACAHLSQRDNLWTAHRESFLK